jgi:hypothetical protein
LSVRGGGEGWEQPDCECAEDEFPHCVFLSFGLSH